VPGVRPGAHALHTAWVLWFDTPSAGGGGGGGGGGGKKTAFGSNLRRVASMESIEEFWGVFNNVLCASKLPQGSNYHLFRAGIEPKWEDKANEQGGKWVLTLRRDKTQAAWMSTCIAAISEQLESDSFPDKVCGVVVSVRKNQDRLSVWIRSGASNEAACLAIGTRCKTALKGNVKLAFQLHGDAMKNTSSFGSRNAVWTL